jgi:hypothetical protein
MNKTERGVKENEFLKRNGRGNAKKSNEKKMPIGRMEEQEGRRGWRRAAKM